MGFEIFFVYERNFWSSLRAVVEVLWLIHCIKNSWICWWSFTTKSCLKLRQKIKFPQRFFSFISLGRFFKLLNSTVLSNSPWNVYKKPFIPKIHLNFDQQEFHLNRNQLNLLLSFSRINKLTSLSLHFVKFFLFIDFQCVTEIPMAQKRTLPNLKNDNLDILKCLIETLSSQITW